MRKRLFLLLIISLFCRIVLAEEPTLEQLEKQMYTAIVNMDARLFSETLIKAKSQKGFDTIKNSLLYLSSRANFREAVRLLLQSGADRNYASPLTPLNGVCYNKPWSADSFETMLLLLEFQQENTANINVNLPDVFGVTPLDVLAHEHWRLMNDIASLNGNLEENKLYADRILFLMMEIIVRGGTAGTNKNTLPYLTLLFSNIDKAYYSAPAGKKALPDLIVRMLDRRKGPPQVVRLARAVRIVRLLSIEQRREILDIIRERYVREYRELGMYLKYF